MNGKNASEIIAKYKAGTCTEEELALVQNWILYGEFDELKFSEAEIKADLKDLDSRVLIIPSPAKLVLRPRIVAVAAAVAAIVFGIWFFAAPRHPDAGQDLAGVVNDIAPGKNTATLTLPNGKTIQLSDAKTGVIIDATKLSYNDGSAVGGQISPFGGTEPFASSTRQKDNKNSELNAAGRGGSNSSNPLSPQGGSLPEGERNGMMLTASTPRGGQYQFTLSDGTKVWLNAASKISFPSQFSGKERKILLSGEAYFEVAKVTQRSPAGRAGRRPERVPFIVESNGQVVEVLGTHFNINAYTDEGNTKTTLLEGSVRVSSLQGGTTKQSQFSNEQTLRPNQQAINTGKEITVKQVDPTEAVAWKNGKFVFEYETIESVMRRLARWYDVEVIYQGDIGNKTFTGSISRKDNISKILEKITYTQNVHFKLEGRRITVMP